jgi:murein DD-endopeptidase MepM/ murein hydrolase activator NlpD
MTLPTMWLTFLTSVLLTAGPGAAGGSSPGCAADRCWPVAGPGVRGRPLLLRAFDPPPVAWAAGHRGVDLAAAPGTAVRAAAAGEVTFAGLVGGTPVVVVALPDGLRTSYEPVRGTLPVGTAVPAGRQVGVLTGRLPHCALSCLHWGLLRGDAYLDPLSLLPPALLRSEPSRLLPVPRQPVSGRPRAGPWRPPPR